MSGFIRFCEVITVSLVNQVGVVASCCLACHSHTKIHPHERQCCYVREEKQRRKLYNLQGGRKEREREREKKFRPHDALLDPYVILYDVWGSTLRPLQ